MRSYVAGLLAAGALVSVLLASGAAFADEAKDCSDGIAVLKAEIAKSPPKTTLDKLNKALKGAQRELGEKEYDECLDYVGEGKKAAKV